MADANLLLDTLDQERRLLARRQKHDWGWMKEQTLLKA
jgi:hypothetical protein